MDSVKQYIEGHRDAFERDLAELLRIPSVSADSRQNGETHRAADWVAAQFKGWAWRPKSIPTAGHPLVYAESPPVPGKPVVLVYGHYDVQPPEPLDEWISPPFEPTVRDGNIYARGATDDKGQMLTHVKSVEAWIKAVGKLPLQVKFLIEGEEEVGSEHLGPFVKAESREARLRCRRHQRLQPVRAGHAGDHVRPARHRVLRIATARTEAGFALRHVRRRASRIRPTRWSRCLAALKDEDGRIQVPGFYDDVEPLSERERSEYQVAAADRRRVHAVARRHRHVRRSRLHIARTPLGPPDVRHQRPHQRLPGRRREDRAAGQGQRESSASGLVPKQDPKKIAASLRKFLEERLPPGIQMELVDHHAAPGVVISLDSPYMRAASAAIETAFGRAPVFIREGGSIPIVNTFAGELGADVLLLGWGQNDDNTHSPNEKFSLDDYHRGTLASACLWEEIARISRQQRRQERFNHRDTESIEKRKVKEWRFIRSRN